MELGVSDIRQSLKDFFGFDKFKGLQEPIIKSVLEGHDTFVIMPTGGGKSLCYQLPALMLPGTALIISPLIALMKNQVDSIRGYSKEENVAHFLNSSLNKTQAKKVRADVLSGTTKLLFVAPETLTKDENVEFLKNVNVSFVAIDEAHCISEWGHDFRPEYRKIKEIVDGIGRDIPVIALTATATPKVRHDIIKNLAMTDVKEFVSSFNRDNLYYEVRPKPSKSDAQKSIVQYVKTKMGKSGIVYVQSRKSTEEVANFLKVNDIKAAPYHAGMDSKSRTKVQDDFLMEKIDVICATIAFGMGIDKPDVRFVIHYDIPKSIENYYQETGRAGRDGLEGECIAFYSYKDIRRLEKFLRDKTVAEREMGAHLLEEMICYAETSGCRRKFLLHYFGEEYDEEQCSNKCDNCKYPKEKIKATEEMGIGIQAVLTMGENYGEKEVVEFLIGKNTQINRDYRFDQQDGFGEGQDEGEIFWNTILRQGVLLGYLQKDIEQYGVLRITAKGKEFLKNPEPIEISIIRDYEDEMGSDDEVAGGSAALDETLLKMLQSLRKKVAQQHNLPPFVIFQDPSLEDMALQYPLKMEDMTKISGVSQGKAMKYARPFLDMIREYVEENEIERPDDILIKQVAEKSVKKIAIIKSIDRKIPLEDIAFSNNLSMEDLIAEIEMIVSSGTKVNIDYYIEDAVDDYAKEEIYDYFMDAETDDPVVAYHELKEDDITIEEIRLMRIKFFSDLAN
ncbi:MAG: DNA helicase RecQ [Saprospirales bacterium]|nr:MAG: DNA helicase RecQ [Saprospirales bacterium]